MNLGLEGKVAIVTGAATPRGNGAAIALTLAEEGVDVACADINIEGAQGVAEKIRGMGRKSLAVKTDQSDYEQVKDAVRKIRNELGAIDILVNNAALISNIALLSKMMPEAWRNEVAINLSGPYYWTKEVFDGMAEKGWGRIINISSVAGIMGGMGQCGYSSCKGGLIALAKTTALEGVRYGITANTVTLGLVSTEGIEKSIRPDMQERLKKRIPMRRLAEPSEVASIVTFLASDKAKYITGSNIIVDGGIGLFVF
jgi:3-oxoacyl-[acyl-carrier protein] reductase